MKSILGMNIGRIDVICGPRYAGKTTELIRLINKYSVLGLKPIVIKKEQLEDFNCVFLEELSEIFDYHILQNDVIAIDDAHLYENLSDIVPILADKYHKKIIVAGLDNEEDFKIYENIVNLIPHAESLNKLQAFCEVKRDGTPAAFTKDGVALSRPTLLKKKVGYLNVITGPMYCGKSTEIIRLGNKYLSIGKKVLAINYSKDTRYDKEGKICSHNLEKFNNTISLENLDDIFNLELETIDIILIDEIQFFKNSLKYIKQLVENYQKTVIVAGLDGDFKREPFGDVCKLVAYADEAKKLNAICYLGKIIQDAPFSKRIVKGNEQEMVGSNGIYLATSREIYNLKDEDFFRIYEDNTSEKLL